MYFLISEIHLILNKEHHQQLLKDHLLQIKMTGPIRKYDYIVISIPMFDMMKFIIIADKKYMAQFQVYV